MNIRAGLIVLTAVFAGAALPTLGMADDQAEISLVWPDEDHVRPPGRYMLEGRYRILDPGITFAKAGFIINNTPYDAVTYQNHKFAFAPTFRAGEYLVEAFIVDTEGQMFPGEAHRLYIRKGAGVTQPETPESGGSAAENTAQSNPSALNPAFKGEGLKAYIEFDAPVDGQPWGSFMSFPPTEAELTLEPQVNWQGNQFEASLRYTKPSAEIWDESRKVIAKTRWEISYRVFGTVAADEQSLTSITFEYKAECRLDSDQLWEYYEGHYALTNVPGGGRDASSNNPLATGGPGYVLEYSIDGNDRSTLDHVLELSYRHGYPAYPQTEYQISTTSLTRVNFKFTGW